MIRNAIVSNMNNNIVSSTSVCNLTVGASVMLKVYIIEKKSWVV